MPQLCTVCTHPKRKEIDLALVRAEQSNRAIASDFGLHESSVKRHRVVHLAPILQQALAEQTQADKIDCNLELAKCFARVNKLFDACDVALTDPNDSERYTLAPNADEIEVIYFDHDGQKSVRRKESLSVLLARIENKGGLLIDTVQVKRIDASKRMLEAAHLLSAQIERIGKLFGLFNGSIDRARLDAMRNGVLVIQQRLSTEFNRQLSWEETIEQILLYNNDASNRAYLNKLKEDPPTRLLPSGS
jgi:hypothetical protein